MACATLILECVVVSGMLAVAWSSPAAQFDEFDPFDDSFYEPGPPYLGDVAKNIPRVGRRNDFFLKAAKSVPRIGRRSPADSNPEVGRRNDFFLKAAKSVPRIGRRNDFFLKAAKSVPRIGRRDETLEKRSTVTDSIEGGEMSAWPWFRNPDLIPRAFKRSYPLEGWEAIALHPGHVIVYESDLHKEVEEPRLQAEV